MASEIIRKGSLVLALLAAVTFISPAAVLAQSRSDVCKGVGVATGAGGNSCAGGSGSVNGVIRGAVQLLSTVVGVAAVVMIIYSGFKFITAGGDASKVSSAQQTITYALVGLVIAALAQVIVRFVLDETVG